jgi:hypothetical protein
MVSDDAATAAGGAEEETTAGRQGSTMSDWREQEVENETRSRDINERIDESNESEAGTTEPFVCECSDGTCTSLIDLTHVEYEEVRAHGTHFAIATDHESPDLDLMVSERTGFAIIRKLPGLPARIANASDPRRVGARA